MLGCVEVMKGLWAKKQARLNRGQTEGGVRVEIVGSDKPRIRGSDHQLEKDNKVRFNQLINLIYFI